MTSSRPDFCPHQLKTEPACLSPKGEYLAFGIVKAEKKSRALATNSASQPHEVRDGNRQNTRPAIVACEAQQLRTHTHEVGQVTATVRPEGTSITIQLTGDSNASKVIVERTG